MLTDDQQRMATSSNNSASETPVSPAPACIGKRIVYEGHTGTIRFYGPVPPQSAKLWYGIEWDDPARGKHSGQHEGTTYFQCTFVPYGERPYRF